MLVYCGNDILSIAEREGKKKGGRKKKRGKKRFFFLPRKWH
jgi:hypothetical protein